MIQLLAKYLALLAFNVASSAIHSHCQSFDAVSLREAEIVQLPNFLGMRLNQLLAF